MKNVPKLYTDPDFDIMKSDWTNWPMFSMPFFSNLFHTHGGEVTVWEEPNEVVVEAAAPGISPENVEMNFTKGVLTIRAEKKEEKADEKKKFYQRSNASYVYRLTVPGEIDEKVEPKAQLKDGMLQVRFKKNERSVPKKIHVQKG